MRLLVIGGVAAGLSAAARARRIDPALEIVVLEKGQTISYGACGLPYYVEGRVRDAAQLVVYTPEYFHQQRNITVRTGARVVSIAHQRRQVALESGERVHYDRLVIATGASPAAHGIAGTDLPYVFTLHSFEDGVRLRKYLVEQRPKRAVVIGAGYIGLEAVDALRRNGLAVTLVEQDANMLQRGDPELTRALVERLALHRVEVRCGERVRSVEDYGADLVVLAAGIRPNIDIAVEAGVATGSTGAIRVDDRMQTSLNGVYAAGDCAEAQHVVTGKPVYVPLGTTANKMGRIAGANAAGAHERFGGIVGTAILSVFGLGVAITGLSAAHARRNGFDPVTARVQARSRPSYLHGKPVTVELVADRVTRRLLGGTVLGEDDAAPRINVIATGLHNRMRAEDFEGLDLAYAPPFAPVWDPLLICAQQLVKQF